MMNGREFLSKLGLAKEPGQNKQARDGGLSQDLAVDVHEALDNQQARGARVLLWLSLLAVVVLLVWASFARPSFDKNSRPFIMPSFLPGRCDPGA
ncbi:MAG TPA: hypothetical protein VL003_12560, partial [Pusillimonas sp.]|nr:hypothetical protein [Pusillimonas sp.]